MERDIQYSVHCNIINNALTAAHKQNCFMVEVSRVLVWQLPNMLSDEIDEDFENDD